MLETRGSIYGHLSQEGGYGRVPYNILYIMWPVTILCTIIQGDSIGISRIKSHNNLPMKTQFVTYPCRWGDNLVIKDGEIRFLAPGKTGRHDTRFLYIYIYTHIIPTRNMCNYRFMKMALTDQAVTESVL